MRELSILGRNIPIEQEENPDGRGTIAKPD